MGDSDSSDAQRHHHIDFSRLEAAGRYLRGVILEESSRPRWILAAVRRALSGKLVSAEYFKVFGTKAAIGRTFAPGEDQPGAAPVVVISYSLWQSRFGGDPGILNRHLMLDGRPHRIIGVLPPGISTGTRPASGNH